MRQMFPIKTTVAVQSISHRLTAALGRSGAFALGTEEDKIHKLLEAEDPGPEDHYRQREWKRMEGHRTIDGRSLDLKGSAAFSTAYPQQMSLRV